jgi:Arc/MetJ-type ribon-helix-helix transcriptional regulator
MPKVVAQIPDDIYKNINEEVKLGIFDSTSEAVSAALKKAYASKSRTYLRWLMKKEGITESEMLKELSSLRK